MEKGLNTSCTIYTLLNKQRVRSDGTARIYIRVSISPDSKKIPLPLYWPVDHYDYKKNMILPRMKDDPDHLTFTALIESEKAKYWKVVKMLLLKDVAFTIKDIVTGVTLGDKGKIMGTWMLYKIIQQQKEKLIKPASAKNHRCSANYLLKYRPEDIEISTIDSKWLNKYIVWLMKSMAYAGAWSRVKDLKSYIRLAGKAGITIHEDFKNHYLAPPEHDPVYLEREELDLLFQMYRDENTSPENRSCLRTFLFNCFTGLRISDLRRFEVSWIQNDEIVFTPTKARITDKKEHVVKIPVIPIAKEFLDTLNGDNLLERSDVKYNKRLKTIAALAGIKKNITAHVARHSFATQLAVLGVPVIVISKLLGHKTIVSTMIYIHIAEKIKKKEMDKLQNAFSGYSLTSPLSISA